MSGTYRELPSRVSSWIVILAHGSRDARWREPFEEIRRRVAAQTTTRRVALAYLQFCEPTLEQVLTDCREAGGEEALVIPAFMSGGGHLLRDVPEAVLEASRRAGIRVRQSGALAEEPEVLDALVAAVLRLAG